MIPRLPTTLIHQILSFLDIKSAFLCSSASRSFHTAASYYFYEEYVKENWNLPQSPSAIIDFFMMKSRQLWVAQLLNLSAEPRLSRIQNVKTVSQGYKFLAYATHKHEIVLLKNDEVWYRARFEKPIEEVAAGVGIVGILLKGGGAETLKVTDEAVDRVSVSSEEIFTHVCVCLGNVVLSAESGKVYSWDGSQTREFVLDPAISTEVLSLKCTTKVLLILFEGGRLYKSDGQSMQAVQEPFFKKKPVGLIATGVMHSLALHREELPPLSQWTTSMLLDWLSENKFEDCVGVVTHGKISGKDFENAEDDYFLDVLGITEVERQNRLKYLRSQVRNRSYSNKFSLYGWGKNNDSQLAAHDAVYHQPVLINLPKLKKTENIKSVLCTKTQSIIHTTEGRVFALGGVKLKTRTAESEALTWTDVTMALNSNEPKRMIEEVFPCADELHYLAIKRTGRDAPQKRLKGADLIMKQIIWDPHLNFGDFVVGYEDRFLGIIEMPAVEFSRSEIPNHRIRYFKRGGEVMWDRRTRMNLL